MRHEWSAMSEDESLALLRRVPVLHLAGVGKGGKPILRAMHFALSEDTRELLFHCAPVGEKLEAVGGEAICSAVEHLVDLPSSFASDHRACAASALFRSVLVKGRLRAVEDMADLREGLRILMETHEPGGDWRLPGKPGGVIILRLDIGEISGQAWLAQRKSPAERGALLLSLWRRGGPGDLAAMDAVLASNPHCELPDQLLPPEGFRFILAPATALAAEVGRLLEGRYWTREEGPEQLGDCHLGSPAWIVAVDESGRLVGSARAGGDGFRKGWLFDIVVREEFQGLGLGGALTRCLLDHPILRDVQEIGLNTLDAQGFYTRFGFEEHGVTASGSSIMYLRNDSQF